VKVKKRKPTVVKPPAGDVASSGGDYGRKKAAPTVKRELKAIRVRQTQVKDVKSNRISAGEDLPQGSPGDPAPAQEAQGQPARHGANVGITAVPGLSSVAAISDKALGTKILPGVKKAVKNAPADAADLAVSTPTSSRSSRRPLSTTPRRCRGCSPSPTSSWRSIRASSSPRSPSARC
jgi:hypothetical protein